MYSELPYEFIIQGSAMGSWKDYNYSIHYLLEKIGDEISGFFGFVFSNRFVESFTNGGMAILVASVLIGLLLILSVIMFIVHKVKRKSDANMTRLFAFNISYLMIAFYVMNYGLQAIGNDVFAIFYILLLIILPLIFCIKYKNEQQKRVVAETLIETESGYIEKMKSNYEEMRKMSHDFEGHFITIETLLQNNNIVEASEYLANLRSNKEQITARAQTGNPYIDAVLDGYIKKAKEKNIVLRYKCEGNVSQLDNILSVCTFLNNALSNAIEACVELKEKKDSDDIGIELNIISRKDIAVIIKNTCDVEKIKRHRLNTTKSDRKKHGIGMRSIDSAIKKMNGFWDWTIDTEEGKYILMANWRRNLNLSIPTISEK